MKIGRRSGCCAIALIFAISICLSAVCGATGAFGKLPSAPPSAITELPFWPASSGVLFADDFSSEQKSTVLGWGYGGSEGVERSWSGDKLVVTIKSKNGSAASYVNRYVGDFGAEIEAEAEDKPGIEYGIAFRYSLSYGRASLYEFMITSDGKYYLFKFYRDQVAYKSPVPVTTTPLIHPAPSKNRLGVLAQGSTISLFINGQLVGTVTDDSLTSGSVAMFASSGPNDLARISFDRMTLYTVDKARTELEKQ